MYHDEFYDNFSDFEQQVSEFKQSLLKGVKEEYQRELEQLRKENVELEEIKSKMDEIEAEHRKALSDFQREKEKIASEAKRMRLVELLGENMTIGWFAKTKYTERLKCELCDDKRQIEYTKPSGAKAYELCYVCGSAQVSLEPEEIEVYKFTQRRKGWSSEYPRIERYYTRKEERDWDNFEACRDVYMGESFEKVNNYRMVFLTLEDCQKYCDWYNAKKSV